MSRAMPWGGPCARHPLAHSGAGLHVALPAATPAAGSQEGRLPASPPRLRPAPRDTATQPECWVAEGRLEHVAARPGDSAPQAGRRGSWQTGPFPREELKRRPQGLSSGTHLLQPNPGCLGRKVLGLKPFENLGPG